jgi:hypothetical protein
MNVLEFSYDIASSVEVTVETIEDTKGVINNTKGVININNRKSTNIAINKIKRTNEQIIIYKTIQ